MAAGRSSEPMTRSCRDARPTRNQVGSSSAVNDPGDWKRRSGHLASTRAVRNDDTFQHARLYSLRRSAADTADNENTADINLRPGKRRSSFHPPISRNAGAHAGSISSACCRRHLAGSLGVVIEPMRAYFKSPGAAVVSVPELLRVTCDPYSPTTVSLTVVRTENPEISAGPCTDGPLRLHVRLGIPSTSIGASTVRPPRYGVTPLVEVEKVQPAGCFS